jgi:hypothetical protein
MKTTLLMFAFLFANFACVAGNTEPEDIIINGKKVGKLYYDNCMLASCETYTIKDTAGKMLFKIVRKSMSDKQNTTTGTTYYDEWIFFELDQKSETKLYLKKKILGVIIESELLTEEGLSETGVKNFCMEKGTPFSDEYKLQNQKSSIIIVR